MRSLERRTRRLEEVAGGRGQTAFIITHDDSIEEAQRKYMEEHPEKPAPKTWYVMNFRAPT